ncbi:hypothetical protein RJ639_013432 [Escallonia herrerae]|uniref:RNase H type-1 domain-containing protein n=1 Tax=Escallonia herrerae TaxID=1293975 RepID=A0AA88VI51_9ASTE|nr:hypothetical protein RJ639_013432 [Escallonia herrerae]
MMTFLEEGDITDEGDDNDGSSSDVSSNMVQISDDPQDSQNRKKSIVENVAVSMTCVKEASHDKMKDHRQVTLGEAKVKFSLATRFWTRQLSDLGKDGRIGLCEINTVSVNMTNVREGLTLENDGEIQPAPSEFEGGGQATVDELREVNLGDEGCSNNEAKYEFVIVGLELALQIPIIELTIYGDSQLVVKQLRGEYIVRRTNLVPYHERANQLLSQFEKVQNFHIRRGVDAQADSLTGLAALTLPDNKTITITVGERRVLQPLNQVPQLEHVFIINMIENVEDWR